MFIRSLAFVVTLLLCAGAFAQTNTYQLKEVLDKYEANSAVKLSYDPQLISFFLVDSLNLGDGDSVDLKTVIASFPLEIDFVDEEYAVISSREMDFTLHLQDSASLKPIEESYANVLLNGQVIYGGAVNAGELSFPYRPRVGDSLKLYVAGFENIDLTLEDLLGKSQPELQLSRTTFLLDHVVIQDYLTKGIDLNPVDQSIGISVNDLPSLPGETDGDIFASLGLLPGLSSPDNRAGSLFIRGSAPDQSLVLYDNIPIYHTGYYFGTISPYNPKMVDNVNIYRSGIHPGVGDRVGGAIVLNSSENLSEKARGGVGFNSLYALGYAKAPVFKNKVGLAVGARKSYPASVNSPKLDAITDVVYAGSAVETGVQGNLPSEKSVFYEDYNIKLEGMIAPNMKLSASGIYTSNEMSYAFDLDSGVITSHAGFKNHGVNVTLDWKMSEKIQSKTSATYSKYRAFFREGKATEENLAINNLSDFNVKQGVTWRPSGNLSTEFGVGYKMQKSDYRYRAPRGEFDTTATRNMPYDRMLALEGNTATSYLNLTYHLSRLTTQFGLRACYYDLLDEYAFMPRLFMSYDLNERWIAKGSFGMYQQFLSQIRFLEFSKAGFENQLWLLADDDEGTGLIDGRQVMLGFLYTNDRFVFDVEGYHKTTNNVTYASNKRFRPNTTYLTADYEAYGIDLFVKLRATQNLDFWAGYTYSRLMMSMDTTSDGEQYPSKYDQPHKFYFGGSFAKGNFNLSGGWKSVSGQYGYSAEVRAIENGYKRQRREPRPPQGSQQLPPRPPNPFNDLDRRLEMVHMLDISASYKLPKKHKRPFVTTFGVSLLNVFNRDNLTDVAIRSSQDLGESIDRPVFLDRDAIGFAPNLMISVEW